MIRRPLRPLMIQGTGSHVGKSFLTMALCRIFLRRGYEVSPFKAQNMANNSAAVIGGEIGRAQALQAVAARNDPDVRMNPLLLKPSRDRRCQAVLLGKAVGTFSVKEIDARKPRWFKDVRRAFRDLESEHDLVIIEGAGSPAEINLRHADYANMRVAAMANAVVILVGDIDRGGVFASLYGTFNLLTPAERSRILGLCINKFRGDPALLRSGLRFLKRETGKDVLGVIPFDTNLRLPEEDSLALGWRSTGENGREKAGGRQIVLGLVRTPHIANFTDFDPFHVESDVQVRDVRAPRDLAGVDAVMLPGSKNVFDDFRFLKRTGLADSILKRDFTVVGICGGYQLMGMTIQDLLGVENGTPQTTEGLGLLPVETRFFPDKVVRPVVRRHLASRSRVRGYEIHSGRMFPLHGSQPLFEDERDGPEGCIADNGRLWGTLTHGVFDADKFRNIFLNRLRRRKRIPQKPPVVFDIEPMIERAADIVENHLDVDCILRRLKP